MLLLTGAVLLVSAFSFNLFVGMRERSQMAPRIEMEATQPKQDTLPVS